MTTGAAARFTSRGTAERGRRATRRRRGDRLARQLLTGPPEAAKARLQEIRALLGSEADAGALPREVDVRTGYGSWADHYDGPGNPVIELEQPAVWSLFEDRTPGRALDAACGTGRHAARLVELGWEVDGVDLTPEMLALAAEKLPSVMFREGDLRALPFADANFDLVVCGLAIAHLADPDPALAELARVLAPGGRLIVSVLHPFQVELGWPARYRDADGHPHPIREHPHRHQRYLEAFLAAGLVVAACREPSFDAIHSRSRRGLYAQIPEATEAAFAGTPAVLVWAADRPAV